MEYREYREEDFEAMFRLDEACFEPQNGIGLSPHLARRLAVDSAEAFDHIARAALGFAGYEDDRIFCYAEGDDNYVIRRERS